MNKFFQNDTSSALEFFDAPALSCRYFLLEGFNIQHSVSIVWNVHHSVFCDMCRLPLLKGKKDWFPTTWLERGFHLVWLMATSCKSHRFPYQGTVAAASSHVEEER